jgi:arylsulfatase A-like enzyme
MKRLAFTFAFVALWVCAFAQPNVIVIMADQLRYDVLGDMTPNIMSLQRDGVMFDKAYCASPICVPSRASFFTGTYPNTNGSLINGWEDEDASFGLVRKGIQNLYTAMEGRWDSWHVGKQHLLTEEGVDGTSSKTKWITQKNYNEWLKTRGARRPGGKQFKASVPEQVSGKRTHTRDYSIPVVGRYEDGVENFLDRYIGNECVRAIRERDKKKPLLLNAMFLAPHPPFDIPEPYFSVFDKSSIKVPSNVGEWYDGQSPLQLYNITGVVGTRYSRKEWTEVWAKYLGLVKLLDDEVGRIINTLKEEGLYDNSIIVFTADHGEMLGSHSLWQKMCMYEESARVPLIIKFPKNGPRTGHKVSTPVSLVDVYPTLLESTGQRLPSGIDGRSLIPLVTGKGVEHRPVFIQYDGNGSLGNFQRCVVDGDFKLIVDIFKDETFLELYNLAKDPQETTNLALDKTYGDRVRELLRLLGQHMDKTGDRLRIQADQYERFLSDYNSIVKK